MSNKLNSSKGAQKVKQLVHQQNFSNTIQFEQILVKALQMQEQMVGSSQNVIKLSKHTKTFKEVAEALLCQLDYLKRQGNLRSFYKNPLTDDELEVATISTQLGNQFEEEMNQMREIVREKDHIIDILTKEKNFYARRSEQNHKLNQNNNNGGNSELDQSRKAFEEGQMTIKNLNEVIERQAQYIKQFENTLEVLNVERDSYLSRVQNLEQEIQESNQLIENLTNELESNKVKLENTDLSRMASAQLKMIENIVRENAHLKQQNKSLKEYDPLANALKDSENILDPNYQKMMEIIQDIFFQIPSQRKAYNQINNNCEEQLLEIKKFVENKLVSGSINPMPNIISPTKLHEQIIPSSNTGIPTAIKYDSKFTSVINLTGLDNIYRDFFGQGHSSQNELVEQKNRSFKDLYNLLEDSVIKFYDLFVKFKTFEHKNQKLEETFIQLDSVFSNEQPDNEDNRVLEELRRLNQVTLAKYFEVHRELSELQALDGAGVQLLKLIKKQNDKSIKTNQTQNGSSLSSLKNQENLVQFEQQVIELKLKLQEQDKIISKLRENRKNKKSRQKSGGRSPRMQDGEMDSSINITRKHNQIKSLDRSQGVVSGSQGYFQSSHIQNQGMREYTANIQNNPQFIEISQNLNKALDKLYEQEEKFENIDKEKTLLNLEYNQLKMDYEKARKEFEQNEIKLLNLHEQNLSIQDERDNLVKELSQLKLKLEKISNEFQSAEKQVQHYTNEVEVQADKAKKIAQLNEELRDLIAQERQANSEEKMKLEEDLESVKLSWETKIKLMKNKLLMTLQNEGYFQDFHKRSASIGANQYDSITLDEAVKMACDALMNIKQSVNYNQKQCSTLVSHQASISTNHSRQISGPYQQQQTLSRLRDVSPIHGTVLSSYDSRYQPNLNDMSKLSCGAGFINDTSKVYETPINDISNNNIIDKHQRTPSKFITLQPCAHSSSKKSNKTNYNDQYNSNTSSNQVKNFDTFNDLNATRNDTIKTFDRENNQPQQILNKFTLQASIPDIRAQGASYEKLQPEMQSAKLNSQFQSTPKDFQSTSNTIHSYLQGANSVSQQNAPKVYSSMMNHRTLLQQQNQQPQQPHIIQTRSLNHVLSPQTNFSLESRPLNQKRLEQLTYTPGKPIESLHSNPSKSSIEMTNNKRKNINEILNSFKKEKESFNEKLTQLKIKLESVKSPEVASLSNDILDKNEGIRSDVSQKHFKSEFQGDTLGSPQVENRRAKTLQKLKGNYHNQHEQAKKIQYAHQNYFNCQ